MFKRFEDGCTVGVIMPDATEDGSVIVFKNTDASNPNSAKYWHFNEGGLLLVLVGLKAARTYQGSKPTWRAAREKAHSTDRSQGPARLRASQPPPSINWGEDLFISSTEQYEVKR